jgi:hypothetical protein
MRASVYSLGHPDGDFAKARRELFVGVEPGAELRAECFVFGIEIEIHQLAPWDGSASKPAPALLVVPIALELKTFRPRSAKAAAGPQPFDIDSAQSRK